MIKAIALRHVHFEDAGTLETVLADENIHLQYVDVGIEDLTLLDNNKIDLLVILGGPISANDSQSYPFLQAELNLIEERLNRQLPTIGICLGAQLIAKALKSRIYTHNSEIGWSPLVLSRQGINSPAKHLGCAETNMFHWHGETFDLPTGAKLLASTSNCQNQIFTWGRNTIAIQCHPEVQANKLENWLIGHVSEINNIGISIPELRRANDEFTPRLETCSKAFFSDWLTNIGMTR